MRPSIQSFRTRIAYAICISSTLLLAAVGLAGLSHAAEGESPTVVGAGNQVSIEYTLKLDDGSVADSNVGGEALTYQQGASQLLPALEEELLGLKVGDSKQVDLSAAQGYGEINQEAFQRVPVDSLPEDARTVGTQLVAQAPTGEQQLVRVHEVTESEIVMDFNHPLAGQALHFDVKILSIE